ncbi:DUF4382 domain-containing protein [Deminuibacter soli]|uniref:DUF4382 domain-containing protein n=1 Tax=Deminuibacter soli TaxID=2291815 RepID=A0A3E1NEV5_9BACT|nr:DUF4382 domain-containing protein [Deminuibacter soli]RFM26513.1 DUF4382 domain-containing protein [Deminuibacter soli]
MQTTNLFKGMAAAAITIAVALIACSKNESSQQNLPPAGKQAVSLYLTDDPGFFDNVYVDIQSVQVLVDTCSNSQWNDWGNDNRDSCRVWDDLQIRAGVYDILSLRNGLDTLFAQGNVPKGKIKYIKIQLGTQNSLVKDSVTYPLHLPAAFNGTILLKFRGDEFEQFESGRCRLWLDFDIARSIIKVRDGMFYLNPVLHWFIAKTTGSIQGKVSPMSAFPVITVYNNNGDTSYALPNPGGEFKVRALTAGIYNVFVNASNGYADTTVSNITLSPGKNVKLDKIQLHK